VAIKLFVGEFVGAHPI